MDEADEVDETDEADEADEVDEVDETDRGSRGTSRRGGDRAGSGEGLEGVGEDPGGVDRS